MSRENPRTTPVAWRLVLAVAIVSLLAASCGESGDTGTTGDGAEGEGEAEGAAQAEDADGVISLVLSPDPVWDWLTDTGIRQEMEQEADMQILDSVTWDRFGVYAGGHADVIFATTPEGPDLQEGTDVPSSIFGKFNADRGVLTVRDDAEYEDLCDLEGESIVSYSTAGLTTAWSVLALELCDLELSGDSDDFELVITDVQNMAGLVASGDAEACICPPDFAIPYLMDGELRGLYDGRPVTQLFQDELSDGHRGPQSNVFVASTAWVEANEEEAAFLLSVWERGLEEWRENRAEIIQEYPQHFSATNEAEEEFIIDYLDNTFDWFEESVYLDEEWIEGESQWYELMQDTGYLDESLELPTFTAIEPSE